MSIFPKRTIPQSSVTIHWNFNVAHLKDIHVFPWVRIGVKDPNGKITMLFEDHVLGLPNFNQKSSTEENKPKLQFLNKNTPLLMIAEYLEGQATKEKLLEILQNIQSGRHYYFTYQVPKDAPIGKYTLVSEVHSSGNIRHSKTAKDDFFFVEKISLKNCNLAEKRAVIYNHSEEKTPIKIVSYYKDQQENKKIKVRVFEIFPKIDTEIDLLSDNDYLLYNEERETIPLTTSSNNYIIRNQEVLQLEKNNGQTFLFKNDKEEAYELATGQTKDLWNKADGLLPLDTLNKEETQQFMELHKEGLLKTIKI